MTRQDIKIAIAGTKTESLFRRFISANPALSDRIVTVRKTAARGSTPPGEHMVNLSITAAEFLGMPYGVAMSNAYYTGDDPAAPKTVYLAVTNEEETTLRKLTSFYGESTADFLFRCCRELCALLTQIINVDAGLVKTDNQDKIKQQKKKMTRLRVFVAVLLAALLALAGFTWYYFKANNYTLQDWLARYAPFLLSDQEPALESADNTNQTVDPALLTDASETGVR